MNHLNCGFNLQKNGKKFSRSIFMYILFHNYVDNDRIILFTVASKLRHFTSDLPELVVKKPNRF